MSTPSPKKTNVVLVEDHLMFREQLAHLINKEPDMFVCGQADNIRDGFSIIKQTQPQVAIVDITLKDSNGLELLKDLHAHHIDVPALVLSMHDESLYAERALRAGARGYITKHEASAKVMQAIREVLGGKIYLKPQFMASMIDRVVIKNNATVHPVDRLTDRELEVFELIGRGQTRREIGMRLRVSVTTVETYRARIKEKLNIANGARLHLEASRWIEQRV